MTDQRTTPVPPSLLLSDEIFRLMVESAKDYAIFTTDGEGRVTTWNAGAERVLGFKDEEIIGQDVRIVFTPEDNEHGRADFEMSESLKTGRAEDRRWHMHKDGHRFWADGLMFPLKDDAKRVIGFLKIIRDRTAEKNADDVRDRAESDLRLMLESATDFAIFSVTPEGRIATWDSAARRLFGYDADEIIGQHASILYTLEDRAEGVAEREMETSRQEGRAEDERWHPRKDGSRSYLSAVCTPIRDLSGNLLGFTKVWRDVSERRRLEAERERLLKEAQAGREQLYNVFKEAPSIIAVLRGPEHVFDLVNERYYGLVGHREVLGKTVREALPEVEGQGFFELLDRVYETGEPFIGTDMRLMVQVRPGQPLEERFIDFVYQPVREPDGRISGILAHGIDLTDRKRAEEHLRESEERFRLMADAIPQIVWITDAEGRAEFFNRQWTAYTGMPFEPTTAAAIAASFVHPDDGPPTMAAFEEARRTGTTFRVEHRIRSASGDYRWFLVRAEPHRDPATGAVVRWFGTSTDIHDAKLTEAALREGEERYRTLFTSIDEGFAVIELFFGEDGTPTDYRFVETNPAFEKHTALADPVGKTARELFPDLEAHWFETYGRVARTGEPVRFENEARTMGERWYDVYAFRLGGPERRRVAVIFTDITQRKELERSLRHRARELSDADRRKNEFLAMLAHELRNPLSAIHSAVRVAQSPTMAEHMPHTLEIIERQSKNLARLIDDLLDVSRITQGKVDLKRETVDVIGVVIRAAQAVRPLVEQKKHDLKFQHDFGPLPVDADPTRLEQIIGNLLTNAAKYTEPSGHISVSAVREGKEAVIRVKDDGVGIPAEMLPKVFDLFTQVDRSVARSEGGLGIGLSLVKQLVEMHGGGITASSELGRGSEFTVRLPLLESAAVENKPERAPKVSGVGRRVLIVDDNADTARLTARLLQMMGFEVHVVHDGPASIEAAREHCPEVVLLDIGLPGLNGFEVARHLRREGNCRDTLIIGVSGYGDVQAREEGREAGFDHHLVKPVDVDSLALLIANGTERG